ncbi:hypothetical protein QCD85_18955 [Paenibacillus sp. PsM32]|uniref:Uncharacterized protein n=1 Tax=Paenibacillus kyungheensis TaxID=1452732 RepID=A0AAX3LZX7_9BACL|nr:MULTISPECIES: hypothetical protein [Paenibacillus]MDN4620201.1 hypothetical protein [Paenibacillus sp. PsM32]MDQ1236056.1 hypothetical protein [Paenibacillus sp. SORGH_AS_0306]MDR6108412.1 hypothetical protein [Paenibacillus sp. SORGH_AS_0338]WCT55532.1 hypothetical protein PQ456_20665 [Paenibacillus kyungheensis]
MNLYHELVIEKLLQRAHSNVHVLTQEHFPGDRSVGGKFGMNSRTITLYIHEIEEQCTELFGSLQYIEQYFQIIFAHELGHAHDPMLEMLADELERCSDSLQSARISLRIEENAWEYARDLLPEVEPFIFQTILDRSLEAYYDALTAHQTGNIA